MSLALSTQKRAVTSSSWSTLLPEEFTVRLAERMVADNDIDCYMAFRAVCHNWRKETASEPGKAVVDHTDPTRFQPTKWALLDRADEDRVVFVHVDTGRFLRTSVPILRSHLFVGATSGGLMLLGEKAEPHRTRLLNPFTGAVADFKVRAPAEGVRAVAVTAEPLMVFVSLEDGDILWADQSSRLFKRFNRAESGDAPPTPMAAFDGDVYASDPRGVIFASNVDDVPDGTKRRSAAIVWMGKIIRIPSNNNNNDATSPDEALAETGGSSRYYLVPSGGDLLLVTRPLDLDGDADDQPLVRRVDTEKNVLEPVGSIGSRAIFVCHVRCLSVDADRFEGIRGGCVYFVDPILAPQGDYEPATIAAYQVADGRLILVEECSILEGGCFGPSTITQVFADYCRTIHYHELYQMITSDWEWDFSDSDSDETSSSGSGDGVELWELEEAAEFFGIDYEAEE